MARQHFLWHYDSSTHTLQQLCIILLLWAIWKFLDTVRGGTDSSNRLPQVLQIHQNNCIRYIYIYKVLRRIHNDCCPPNAKCMWCANSIQRAGLFLGSKQLLAYSRNCQHFLAFCCVHKTPPLFHFLSQMNLVHILPPSKTSFYIILPVVSLYSTQSFFQVF